MALSNIEKVDKEKKPSKLARFAQGLDIAGGLFNIADMTGLDSKLLEFAKKSKLSKVKDATGGTPV